MQWVRQFIVATVLLGMTVPLPALAPVAAAVSAPVEAPTPSASTLASQPLPLQYAINSQIGATTNAYHAKAAPSGYRISNPAGTLQATLAADRTTITANGETVSVHLSGWGRQGSLAPITAAGTSDANRVTFAGDGIAAWYVNGPLGLQQGWTIDRRPAGTGPILLALAASQPVLIENDTTLAFINTSGASWLRYRGLLAWDAANTPLTARFTQHGDAVRITVDDSTAVYPITIDPVYDVAALSQATATNNDALGTSLAVSADGSIVAAGVPFSQVDSAAKGAVIVFSRPSAGWSTTITPTATLSRGAAGAADDQLGISVAISADGSIIAAGAQRDGTDGTQRGAVYVYTRQGGTWANQNGSTPQTTPARLTRGAASSANGDNLGSSVSISADGRTIVAGAPNADIDGIDHGALYVYTRQNGAWANQDGSTPAITPARLSRGPIVGIGGDSFGASVAISFDGSTIIGGAPGNDADGTSRGAAAIYARPANVWVTTTTPTATLTRGSGSSADNDSFGWSVAISGNGATAAIGAPGEDTDGTDRGAAYIYERPGAAWVSSSAPTAKFSRGAAHSQDTDRLGDSIVISYDGSVVVAGAALDERDGTDRGAAYLFQRPDNGWVTVAQAPTVIARGRAVTSTVGDQFGIALGISLTGGTIAVGIPGESSAGNDRGAVRVFDRGPDGWQESTTEAVTLLPAAGNSDALAGTSVATSADGSIIAVGMPADSSAGPTFGAVAVYLRPANGWRSAPAPVAILTNAAGSPGSGFGSAVAISSNGKVLAIGAPNDDVVAVNAGAVFVYTMPGAGWSSANAPTATLVGALPNANDNLGFSVAINGLGDSVVAGAP